MADSNSTSEVALKSNSPNLFSPISISDLNLSAVLIWIEYHAGEDFLDLSPSSATYKKCASWVKLPVASTEKGGNNSINFIVW